MAKQSMQVKSGAFKSLSTLLRVVTTLGLAVLASTRVAHAAPAAPRPASRPVVLVHYMPWFSAKPFSANWGWHWTMNAFNPDEMKDGKRHIASHYQPLIGPYDSGDPAVIEYHLLLMKLAGIDGFIVDWYGLSDHFDYAILHRNTQALWQAAAKTGLKMAICYEDQTIPQLVEARKITAAERVPHAIKEIDWLRQNWFGSQTYLKLDGKPVLLSFGQSGLTDDEWEQVLAPQRGTLLYLSEHLRRKAADGAFDWPIPQAGLAGQDRFAEQSKGWPLAMPVAFPRFHDTYAEAKVQQSWGSIDDQAGQTFGQSLQRALTSGSPWVQIATWNDWGEGTMIEPSQEFGYRDLEAVQQRQSSDAKPLRADDLRLAHRLFVLRQQPALPKATSDKLDAIARLIAAGSLSQARKALNALEPARLEQAAH